MDLTETSVAEGGPIATNGEAAPAPSSQEEAQRQRIEEIEIHLLLEGVFQVSGYDFRRYSYASLKRRIWHCVLEEKLSTISAFQERVLRDSSALQRLLLRLTVNISGMFRDPFFYLALRKKIVPLLRTYPSIHIWVAGCAQGDEVYSMAILLQEEGLYEKSRIYATDLNEMVLAQARDGVFPLEPMQRYTQNYFKAGGSAAFSNYYTVQRDQVTFSASLKKNVTFAQHNLATDSSFHEFHLIICRNVLIYFNKELQERVHRLFYDSLVMFGILALGHKETLKYSQLETVFMEWDKENKFYRKIR
jgi:chemotaxis protein methyltransferase CheR